MPVCEWCGTNFDREEAEDEFIENVGLLSYDNLTKCLCGSCAVEAIEDMIDGVYYETCDKCGKKFDLITESIEFDSHFSWFSGTGLRNYWDGDDGILCCDCALEIALNEDGESD